MRRGRAVIAAGLCALLALGASWAVAPAALGQGAADDATPPAPSGTGAPRTMQGEAPSAPPGAPAGGRETPGATVAPGGGEVLVLPEGRGSPGEDARSDPDRERVVAALSHNQVSITTTYAGSEIFVFGAIKRNAPARTGEPDVIVTISGPSAPVTVRRKARMFGVWANNASTVVDAAPSFYAVASTGPLRDVLSATENLRHRIALDSQVRTIGAASDVADPDAFREAVIRLRRAQGLYVEAPIEVEVIESTLFTTHVALPANIVEGDYVARVFLVHDRQVIDLHETVVGVRKVGLERWLFALSREAPLQYGLLALIVALAMGWGASEVFRLMRR